jgi:uncharacterized membrane protein
MSRFSGNGQRLFIGALQLECVVKAWSVLKFHTSASLPTVRVSAFLVQRKKKEERELSTWVACCVAVSAGTVAVSQRTRRTVEKVNTSCLLLSASKV